mmetsp:Transcript_37839/g.52806  ORF Transcript_37839/g.52806 Transcript_37839/m.52806 type:complete len:244 (+) Transcript_37839:256-987(+)
MDLVLMDRLADLLRVGRHVADVVGALISLAQPLAQQAPRDRVVAGGHRAGGGGTREQRAGLGLLVGGEIDLLLALPGLARADAERHPGRPAEREHERNQPLARSVSNPRQGLEGQHDHRVTGQDRQRLAERAVKRGLAPPGGGVVEGREIVVHQRGAVHDLDGGGGSIRHLRPVVAAGGRHRDRQPRPDPLSAGEHRVTQGAGETGRRVRRLAMGHSLVQGPLDPRLHIHVSLPRSGDGRLKR